jgi:hypothetical protein
MASTLGGVFSTLRDNVDRALSEIGTSIVETFNLKDVVKGLIENIGQAVDWWKSLSKETKKVAITIAALLGASGPIMVALGTLSIAIGAISLPLVAVVAAFAGAAVAIAKNWDSIVEYFTTGPGATMWETTKRIVVKTMGIVKSVIKELTDIVVGSIKMMLDWFTSLSADTQESMMGLVAVIGVGGPVIYALTMMSLAVSSLASRMFYLSTTAIPAVVSALETGYVGALIAAETATGAFLSTVSAVAAPLAILSAGIHKAWQTQKDLNKSLENVKDIDIDTAGFAELEKHAENIKQALSKIRQLNKDSSSGFGGAGRLNDLKKYKEELAATEKQLDSTKSAANFNMIHEMRMDELTLDIDDMLKLPEDTGPMLFWEPEVKVEPDVDTDTGGGISEVVNDLQKNMQASLDLLKEKLKFPDIFDIDKVKAEASIYKEAIKKALQPDVDVSDAFIQDLADSWREAKKGVDEYITGISRVTDIDAPQLSAISEEIQNQLNSFDALKSAMDQIGQSYDATANKLAFLKNRIITLTKAGGDHSGEIKKLTAKYRLLNIELQKVPGNTSVIEAAFGSTEGTMSGFMEKIQQTKAGLGDMTAFLAGEVSSAVLSFGNAIGMALSGASNSWETAFEKIMGVVLEFVSSLAKLAAGIGGVMLFIPGFQGMGVGLLAAAAALQAISSGVQAGINKRASNREKRSESDPLALAEGGLAFGPTLATVGDNPGARSNPEVIAPLDKLKGMMGNLQPRQSSSGLSESSLQYAFERALSNKMSRLGPKEVFVLSQQGKRGF